MMLRVEQGKGGKDRHAMLSPQFTNRFSPHPPLRTVRKRRPRPQHRPRARVARRADPTSTLFGNAEESLHQFDLFRAIPLQERIYFPVRRQIFPALPHRENVPKPLK
jgi:hypothetical protein